MKTFCYSIFQWDKKTHIPHGAVLTLKTLNVLKQNSKLSFSVI